MGGGCKFGFTKTQGTIKNSRKILDFLQQLCSYSLIVGHSFFCVTHVDVFLLQEVPFEVNLQNVDCLEAMFDPSRGNLSKTTQAFYTWLSSLLEN